MQGIRYSIRVGIRGIGCLDPIAHGLIDEILPEVAGVRNGENRIGINRHMSLSEALEADEDESQNAQSIARHHLLVYQILIMAISLINCLFPSGDTSFHLDRRTLLQCLEESEQIQGGNNLIASDFSYFYYMIEEFHKVLRSPENSTSTRLLSHTQDFILNSFEQLFPPSFDMSLLHQIYEEVLGEAGISAMSQTEVSLNDHILLNHKLILYFVELIRNNFVHQDVYQALEDQTQKAEATIRSHIKVQQEMKMYLEYLESKLEKINRQLDSKPDSKQLRRQIQLLSNKEAVLLKDKISLIKSNEQLKNQVENLLHNNVLHNTVLHDTVRETDSQQFLYENIDHCSLYQMKNQTLLQSRNSGGEQGLHPDYNARFTMSKRGSEEQKSEEQKDHTKEKEGIMRDWEQSWDQDLTAKKKLSYFDSKY